MKILFLSDTHEQHERLINLPEADLIIHGGDMTDRGKDLEIQEFIDWFSRLNYQYKIFIAGNHDYFFEDQPQRVIQNSLPKNMFYLCDSGIEIEGIKFWGSPVIPKVSLFNPWAFEKNRGSEINLHWKKIPLDTNILITHTPPYGKLDKVQDNYMGCKDLLKTIRSIDLSFHLFGHIHEGYGLRKIGNTTFINGSVFFNLKHLNNPILFEYQKSKN